MTTSIETFFDAADGATLDLQGTGLTTVDEIFDMNDQLSFLNRITYKISVLHDLDGVYIELVTEPVAASEKPANVLWTLMTSGFFHRVKVEANNDLQRWHLRWVEATMSYEGQL